MELTKKYRIVYVDNKMVFPLEPFEDGITYAQTGFKGIEFDTLDEATAFIKSNKLTYEHTTED